MKTLRTWLMVWGLFQFSPGLFAQYALLYSTNGSDITLTGHTGNETAVTGAVTIPNFVTSIGFSAFGNCYGITSVTIGTNVTDIGEWAFSYCTGMTNVTLPNSVASIEDYAFAISGLTSITIPDGVIGIGSYVFYICGGLSAITVSTENPVYSSLNGVLFDKRQTTVIDCPEGFNGSFTIPNTATTIGDEAFQYCTSLTNVTIPNSVTSIEGYAFSACRSLTSVTIPNSVTNFGEYAFQDCERLTNITIPNSVTNLGDGAFETCWRLTSLTIPNSVTNLGEDEFYDCDNLTSVFLIGNAPSADSSVFYNVDNNVGADPTTVYYLPGTTGWSEFSSNTGVPAVLWNPTIQTTDGFGFRSNQFNFTITGTPNIPVQIAATTNVSAGTWTPLQTCTLTNGLIQFGDPGWSNYSRRFYTVQFP